MNQFTSTTGDDAKQLRRYEYDEGMVFAADFGTTFDEGSVDVVDGTVIVVVDDEQHEFDLPQGADAQAFMKNGVLTVEIDA